MRILKILFCALGLYLFLCPAVYPVVPEVKVSDPVAEWVDKLGEHENCPPEGIIDSNKKRSYGKFCYQVETFKMFVKRYNMLPQAEDKEVLNFISDDTFQKELTVRVIRDNPKNWTHWFTSTKKIGPPPNL